MLKSRIFMLLLAGLALPGCGRGHRDYRTQRPDPELLHTAVRQLTSVIVYDIFSPPQSSRVYAYASVAAYEALRQSHSEYRSLAGQVRGLAPVPVVSPDSEYYLPLAGVHAFMTVGRQLTFSRARMDSLRTAMDERYKAMGIPGPVYDRSIAYGELMAKHILAWAATDSFIQTRGYPKYTVTSQPGRWTPTPPAYIDAIEPNWARLRPFVLDSASVFRPKAPPAFDTTEGSPFLQQTREVYETGKHLTDEQKAIAAFWDCNPYVMHVQGHTMFATKKITPGGHWMGIAGIAAHKTDADIVKSAAAYARMAIALADGFISSWDEKYRSNVIRPETVINTYVDEGWTPLLQTPPFPEYTSGHSVISNAAAAVLTDEYGDGFSFKDSTEVDYGLRPRTFASFRKAAEEAAISRMYGGIHYRQSIEEGSIEGRRVGDLVVQRVRTRGEAVVARNTVASGNAEESTGHSTH
jgi:PAP2 superfamily